MSQDFNMPNVNQPGPYGTPPPKKKGSLMWLWILLGVLGGGGVLICACCGGFTMFGLNAAGAAVKESLQQNPVVKEHIGDVQSASMNISEMAKHDGSGGETAWDVVGSKGKGIVYGKLSNDPGQGFEYGTLTTSAGEFDLFPMAAPAP